MLIMLILYLIEMPLNTFANRADPDQAALELPDQSLLCFRVHTDWTKQNSLTFP